MFNSILSDSDIDHLYRSLLLSSNLTSVSITEIAHPIFCCDNAKPYTRPIRTDHDGKFNPFIKAAFDTTATGFNPSAAGSSSSEPSAAQYPHVIQVVKQVNYGPVEPKRFFAPH